MKILSLPKREVFVPALRMAWPAVVDSFFMAFAGLVDSYMVSSLGSAAVASVGLTTQPKFVALSPFIAISVAVSALVARRKGEKKRNDANVIAFTGVMTAVIVALILSVGLNLLADPVIDLCGSTKETHSGAVSYYKIIAGGMVFNSLQIVINAAQRGAGNTKITMVTNVTSNVVNIICNYLLIGGHFGFPALGIKGAALATVFGTFVASVMSIISVSKKERFISIVYIIKEKLLPSFMAFKSLVNIGYGIFFEQILMRIGFMLTAVMAADQGTGAMAAHQVAMNIMGLSFSFGDGLQAAAVALIGHSLGANDPQKAKAYGATCRFMGGVISVVLAALYFIGARPLYRLYFDEAPIIEYGVHIMYIIIFICIFQISQVIYMGCLRGAGDTLYTAASSTVCVTIIRTAGSYIFGYILGFGIEGIWLGVLADQVGRFIFASIRFKQGKWLSIKI